TDEAQRATALPLYQATVAASASDNEREAAGTPSARRRVTSATKLWPSGVEPTGRETARTVPRPTAAATAVATLCAEMPTPDPMLITACGKDGAAPKAARAATASST